MENCSRPMNIRSGFNERIARHRNRDFLNAALAVCVLATQADGTISFSERYRIDGVLARDERLRIYDPHQVAQILDRFLTELHDKPEALLRMLERVADDRKTVELIVRIALSVSHCDGDFSASKRVRFTEICTVLGYAPGCILGERRTSE